MQPDSFKLLSEDEAAAKNTAAAIIREVQGDRVLREENFVKNWDMYQNRHEVYFKQRLDEPVEIFRYRKSNAIKSNLCGFTVDLSAKYLYGKASKIVRRYSENKQTDDSMRKLVSNFHKESLLLDAARKSSIFGETTIRLIPVDSVTRQQVEGKTTETTYPHPVILEPLRTFVKRNKWERTAAVVSQYYATDYGANKRYSITELITDDSRWIWRSEGTLDIFLAEKATGLSAAALFGAAKLVSKEKNTYALEDEFIYLPNNDDKKSDLADIIDLNIALDEALTDKQHFFQKHGWPQLVTEVSLENVAYSPNKIWEVNADIDDRKKVLDRMGFLTWDGKMEDHAKFVKNLERNIMILSNTAAISTGDLEAIGQLRSGAALITAHSVAIHKTEAKQIVWERNEKALFNALARMDAFFHNEKVEARYPDLNLTVRFPKVFVPGAEMEQTQIHQMEINAHIRPLNDILEEYYGDLSQEDLAKKREDIMKDSRDIVDSTREFISEQASPNGNMPGKSGSPTQKSQQQKQPAS